MSRRTISEILTDADNNPTDFNCLNKLAIEVSEHYHSFTEPERDYIKEHLSNYMSKIPNVEALKVKAVMAYINTKLK